MPVEVDLARTPTWTALRGPAGRRRSVFVGHSGVGKSTLVNALIPGALRAIGAVNEVTGRGRHTSSVGDRAAAARVTRRHRRPGWVIDTPGVRSFGLSHVSRDRIVAAFDDLAAITADCPRGCTHERRRAGVRAGRRGRDAANCPRRGWSRSAGCSGPASSVRPMSGALDRDLGRRCRCTAG